MPKPKDDLQDLKRRLVLVDRLGGRLFVCAEGAHLFDEGRDVGRPNASDARATAPRDTSAPFARVRDAASLVAACRAGRPSLAALRAGLELTGSPLPITPSFLAAVHRDLRVLSGPRVAQLVRGAGRMFRRHGDLDAAWLAEKNARLAVLAEAARAASLEGTENGHRSGALDTRTTSGAEAGGGALPAWFERAAEVVGFVYGEDARVAVRGAAFALGDGRLAPGAHKRLEMKGTVDGPTSGRPWTDVGPSMDRRLTADALRGAREERERALTFLAHAALTFDPRPREGGEPTFTRKEIGMDPAAVRALAERFGRRALRLPEALALARLDLKRWQDKIADLVVEGLPVEKVERLVALGRLSDFDELNSGAEGAGAYIDWVSTLGPHYKSLGLELPLAPEVFNRFAGARKSDLAVLAVCMMKHHAKAEPDTAEQALARLDATLALFARRPAEVASILAELTGTTPGAGRAALPEIAAWLDDDELLDRYVHLSRIAGAPVALSRTLRADFERGVTLSREREHLAAMPSLTSFQEARLARLIAGQVAIPSPDKTRRRIADRLRELLARAYEARLDAALRRIAKDAWGITVPRLTPGWRDAIRFYLVVEKNRALLATVLQTASAGGDLARVLPKNQAWIASVSGRFDVGAWLAPRARDVDIGGKRHRLAIERDPIEVLRMGIPFDTCLSLEGGMNAASTVVNAADANKRVIYLRDASGSIVARKLVAVSREHRLIGYRLYIAANEHAAEIGAAFREMCDRLSEATGLPLATEGKPKQIHAGFWYDDGTAPFDRAGPAKVVDVGAYCRSLGVPVPSGTNDDLVEEARAFEALRGEHLDDVAAVVADVAISWTSRRAAAWIVATMERPRMIAAAKRSWKLAVEALRRVADEGWAPMLKLAGKIGGWQGSAHVAERMEDLAPSADIAFALVSAASASSRTGAKFDSDGLEHRTLDLLPDIARRLSPAEGFALCDRVEPLWRWIAAEHASCAGCVEGAREGMIQAIVRAYRAAPAPAAVIERLGGRGGLLGRRAALAIAARFGLADAPHEDAGDARRGRIFSPLRPCPAAVRALAKLRRRAPELEGEPDLLAAILRQNAGVPRGADLPMPKDRPFEVLGDLLAQMDLTEVLAAWTGEGIDPRAWKPGPWELFHLRRTATPLRTRIVREAKAKITRGFEGLDADGEEAARRLAQLGEVDTLAKLFTRCTGRGAGARRTRAILDRARATAKEIAGQMASSRAADPLSAERERRAEGRAKTNTDAHDRGLLVAALAHLDAHVARDVTPTPPPEVRRGTPQGESEYGDEGSTARLDLAFEIVVEADRFLGQANEIAEALVEARPRGFDDDDRSLLLVWLHERREGAQHHHRPHVAFALCADHVLRPHLLGALARTGIYNAESTFRRLATAARAAGREALLPALAAELMAAYYDFEATDISSFEGEPLFRVAVRVLLGRDVAAQVVAAYKELTDHAMMAVFLDELSRSPLRGTDRMRAEAQLWSEASAPSVPVALEWLRACLDGNVPVGTAAGPVSRPPRSVRGPASSRSAPLASGGPRGAPSQLPTSAPTPYLHTESIPRKVLTTAS